MAGETQLFFTEVKMEKELFHFSIESWKILY